MQTKLYIDGELTDGLAGRTIDVINPADGTQLAVIAEALAHGGYQSGRAASTLIHTDFCVVYSAIAAKPISRP